MNDAKTVVAKENTFLKQLIPPEDTELSDKEISGILAKAALETGAGMIPFAGKIINFVQKVEDEKEKIKMSKLLSKLKEQHESNWESFTKLLTSKSGFSLFQKVVHILKKDDDNEFLQLLVNVISNISTSDFEEMFEGISYALSQMEKLSAHALVLLSKHGDWEGVRLQGATGMGGGIVCLNWDKQVTDHFAKKISLDEVAIKRVTHAFRELESNGIIENTKSKTVDLTDIGKEVFDCIQPRQDTHDN